jgi:hypothetical protein
VRDCAAAGAFAASGNWDQKAAMGLTGGVLEAAGRDGGAEEPT